MRPCFRMTLVCSFVVVAVAFVMAAYLVPLPFSALSKELGTIQPVFRAAASSQTVLSSPSVDVLELTPGSKEEQSVQTILSHYDVHRCVHTLSGDMGGENPLFLLRTSELELTVTDGCHVLMNGSIYRVGWIGDYQGRKLADELSWALGLNETI